MPFSLETNLPKSITCKLRRERIESKKRKKKKKRDRHKARCSMTIQEDREEGRRDRTLVGNERLALTKKRTFI